jgi:peptidoglycan/LPS O-acetylase OafA/YrhL
MIGDIPAKDNKVLDHDPNELPANLNTREEILLLEDQSCWESKDSRKPPRRELAFLDGLRGIMASVVVVHHFCCTFFPVLVFGQDEHGFPNDVSSNEDSSIAYLGKRLPYDEEVSRSPLAIFWAGKFAVGVLFIMSGHVVALRYLKTGDADVITKSAVCRIPRLAIPALGALLFALLLASAHTYSNLKVAEISGSDWLYHYKPDEASLPSTLKLWAELLYTFGFGSTQYLKLYPAAVVWSIPVEIRGSFVVYALSLTSWELRRRCSTPEVGRRVMAVLYVVLMLGCMAFGGSSIYDAEFTFGLALAELRVDGWFKLDDTVKMALPARVGKWLLYFCIRRCCTAPAR